MCMRKSLAVLGFTWALLPRLGEAQRRSAAQTDNQYEAVRAGDARPQDEAPKPDADGRYPMELRGRFGEGVRFGRSSDDFALLLRARVQLQSRLRDPRDGDASLGARVRRLRLVFGGHALHHRVTYYLQLGFANADLEDDKAVPLRDAFVTFHLHRDLNLRLGQMKVPFDRQRITSSSKLQFVDRVAFVRTLNLDRDAGIQIYSTDLFGLGEQLSYQFGVFNGEGRNRVSSDLGLLYVGRLQWSPFGAFQDLSESDLVGGGPRLALAAAGAYNRASRRVGSTQGAFLPDSSENFLHLSADLLLKWQGASVLAEYLLRRAIGASVPTESGFGVLLQTGYLVLPPWELALRVAHSRPSGLSVLQQVTDLGLASSWFLSGHDLKLQADYTTSFYPGTQLAHLVRLQAQLFF